MQPPVPILLVAGFLGAGKTSVVNHLLAQAEGRRIAALVNDFGAINIDAALIEGASEGVVSLANGCICCSLEGDLLRSLAAMLRRDPRPDHIVIETSGIAEPGEVVRTLMDPVIWREAPLETVLCVLDAATPPARLADPLLRGQVRAADLIAFSKPDLAGPAERAALAAAVQAIRPGALMIEALHGAVPLALVLPADPARPPAPRRAVPPPGPRRPAADRFETLYWTCPSPLSLAGLQRAIGRLAPKLARAKGLFEAADQPGRQFVFQFAAGRASLAPRGAIAPDAPGARIVFIAEIGVLSEAEIAQTMTECVVEPAAQPNQSL